MVKTQANSFKMMRLIFIDATFVPHRNPLCTIDLQNMNIFLIIHMSINSLSSITNRFSPNISALVFTLSISETWTQTQDVVQNFAWVLGRWREGRWIFYLRAVAPLEPNLPQALPRHDVCRSPWGRQRRLPRGFWRTPDDKRPKNWGVDPYRSGLGRLLLR